MTRNVRLILGVAVVLVAACDDEPKHREDSQVRQEVREGPDAGAPEAHPEAVEPRLSGPADVQRPVALGDSPAFAASGVTPKQAASFLRKIQQAVSPSAAEGLVDLIQYPVTTQIGGEVVRLQRDEFVEHYDEIVTSSLRKTVESQEPAELFANYQGVMIGNGDIWFRCEAHMERGFRGCEESDIRIVKISPVLVVRP